MDARFSIRHCRAQIKYPHRVFIGVNILCVFNPKWCWAFFSSIEPSELLFVHVGQVTRIFWTISMHKTIMTSSSSDLQSKTDALHAHCNAWAKQSCQNIFCCVQLIAVFVTFTPNAP